MNLVTWLGYNCVLGGLLPIVLVRVGLSWTAGSTTFARLVKDGQLFLYSALLAAAAIGDLMKEPDPAAGPVARDPLWLFALVVCVMCSTFFFALAACASKASARKVASMSYIFTIGTTALVAGMRYQFGLF